MNLSQLQTMLWLRWRLTRNQWQRNGPLNAMIMMVAVSVGLTLAAIGSVAGVAGGMLGLSEASPQSMMLVFDVLIAVFLFLWMMGLITELQQSEILDLGRFLHLPVALRDVFLLNYFSSLLSFSMAMILPVMLGLTVGLVLGRGAEMLLLLPLVLSFFFMITAWTYCLRSWLAGLMINKRRRRAVVMGVTLAFILLVQLPNLVTNFWLRDGPDNPPQTAEEMEQYVAQRVAKHEQMAAVFDVAHRVVPLLWLPNGARALTENRVWPALWGAIGMLAIGTWGMARAYRSTICFYQGSETAKATPALAAVATQRSDRKILVERRLPGIPEEASALGLATFRSMSRAPEVKMALVMNVLVFGFIGASMLMRRAPSFPFEFRPFLASGAAAVTFMGLPQLLFNHFGFDRSGFRALVLLPTPRHRILLGKTVALAPLALIVFSVFLAAVTALAHLRFLDLLAAGLEFVAAFLVMSVLGNLASILAPYRVAAGSMKRTKIKATTMLLMFLIQFLSIPVMLPLFLPPTLGLLIGHFYGLPVAVVTLMFALLLAALSAFLYWQTLQPLGRLLERREQRILEVVTAEAE